MIVKFFNLYAAEFLNYNASYISDVYEFPMIFYTESGESVCFEENGSEKNTEKLFDVAIDG